MQIQQHSAALVVFLLVRVGAPTQGVEAAKPVVKISRNATAFVAASNKPAEIGGGWYKLTLTPDETATAGMLILCASADGAEEWRDIIQITTEPTVDLDVLTDDVLERIDVPSIVGMATDAAVTAAKAQIDINAVVLLAAAKVMEQINVAKISAQVRRAIIAEAGAPQLTIKLPVSWAVEG